MSESMYKTLLVVGLVLVASVLGILALYSHTIMTGLRHVDDATFVKSYQAIDRQIINPIFMIQFFAPVVILLFAAYFAHKHHLAEAKYIYIAAISYVAAVIITMAVNVPLNDGIKKIADVTSSQSLADARAQFNESKWLIFNHLRTVCTLIATIALSIAIRIAKPL